jgi:hypothetical protein
MCTSKRKRQSTDSAIADMSSEDSFTGKSQPQEDSQRASTLSISSTSEEESQFKRRRGSWTPDMRDFGTAASQRPRRGASRQPTEAIFTPSLPQKSRREAAKEVATGISEAAPDKVNGNNETRRQTPRRKHAPIALPTPPQTAEKSNTQAASQLSLRRSNRERRLTERSQQPSIEQETPCRQKTRASASSVISDRIEGTPAGKNRKSRIVRLRLRSFSTQSGGSQMSFTGSFSHRQKSSQEQDTQASLDLVGLPALQQTSTLLTCDRMKASPTIAASGTLDLRPLRSHGQNRYSRTARICTLHSLSQTMRELLQT